MGESNWANTQARLFGDAASLLSWRVAILEKLLLQAADRGYQEGRLHALEQIMRLVVSDTRAGSKGDE